MRIDKLSLTNFRGFEELEIDFPEGEGGLAVFIGENGSGKTSVLKAISYIFKIYIQSIYTTEKENSVSVLLGNGQDLKEGEESCTVNLHFKYAQIEFTSEVHYRRNEGGHFWFSPPLNRDISFWKKNKSPEEQKKYETIQKNRQLILDNPKVTIYYNVNRFVVDEPSLKAKDITKIQPIDALNNIFQPNISFNDFFEWFRNTEDYENEKRLTENNDFRLNALEAIRDMLNIFLEKFKDPRVKRQPTERLIFKDNGHLLSVANLSHGERLTFAIVGDIIRRLSIANPDLNNPCLGEGVVMIDEIEQHLHPSWQRTIIPNLRKTFPNIQFIVTTHSPQVLSNVPRENVFILEDFKLVEKTPHTFGKDTNTILYDLFGVEERPKHAKEDFNILYRLIDDPKKEKEAEEMLKQLEEKYGKNDPDLLDAKLSFEFLTN